MARGAGVNPEDPPLRWEVSQADGQWAPATVLEDLTGGFNYGSGIVELELPPRSVVAPLGGHRLHWLRCRIAETSVTGRSGATYSHAPEVYSISAAPMGARLPSTHAARVEREILGVSDGTPGQNFPLRHQPVLKLGTGETLEVQDPESGDWSRWESRPDFVGSTEFDRHFVLDLVSGEVELGPAIRETHGGWTQYGAVPPKGAILRFTQLPPRRRPRGQRHGRHAERAQEHDRRHRHGDQPGRRGRRRRRRDHHPRAPARVDGDPLALPRGHRRGLRVHGRRGEPARRARRLHPAARRRRRAAAPRPAHLPGRPPAGLRRADAGGGPADRGRRLPRRPPPDRHHGRAQAVPLPRPVRRRQPAGAAAGRHRARGRGRRARALHVPEPARRRQPDRARRRAGRSGGRSTRASSTASSMPSTASSSCASCASTRPTWRPASSRPSRPARTSSSSPTS